MIYVSDKDCAFPYMFLLEFTLFLVKHAAQLSVGWSKAITVALIGKLPIAGASTDIKEPTDEPHENPLGRAET